MMVMLLRKLGYEIVIASNGREALERLEMEAARGRQFEIECTSLHWHSRSRSAWAPVCGRMEWCDLLA